MPNAPTPTAPTVSSRGRTGRRRTVRGVAPAPTPPAPPPERWRDAIRAADELGRHEDALRLLDAFAGYHAPQAEDLVLRGLALMRLGREAEALHVLVDAVALDAASFDAWTMLARAARALQRLEEAQIALERALALRPSDWTSLCLQGRLFLDRGANEAAQRCFERAVGVAPERIYGHLGLGDCARQLDRFEDALRHFDDALALDAGNIPALSGRGGVLTLLGRYDEAIVTLSRACELAPDDAPSLNNLALVAGHVGDHEAALALFERLIALQDRPDRRFNRALQLLALGRFAEGWADYRHGFFMPGGARGQYRRLGVVPTWDGRPLPADGALVLWAEQGLGDEVMFASLLGEVDAGAARRVLVADARLHALYRRSFPGWELLGRDVDDDALMAAVPASAQLPVGDLPGMLRPDLAAFERQRPHLVADPVRTAAARAWLRERFGGRPVVGLTWKGGRQRSRLENRSVDAADLGRALAGTGAAFVSLQYGAAPEELAALHAALPGRFAELPGLDTTDDIDGTCALIAACSATFGATNAAVHLGAGLGVPGVVLVPYLSDWRWTRGRDRSPWYPHTQVVRQSAPRFWADALEAACERLDDLLRSPARTPPEA